MRARKAETGLDRRDLIQTLLLAGGASLLGERGAFALGGQESLPVVPFEERLVLEPGVRRGEGLEARLAYPLSEVTSRDQTVEAEDFYLRTAAPPGVMTRRDRLDDWKVRIRLGDDASGHLRDFGGGSFDIPVGELRRRAEPLGLHLLECSGNGARAGFGLMSATEWTGFRMADLLAENFSNLERRSLIRVTGVDDHPGTSRSSHAGASWIFTAAQLRESGAFLATEMNGVPLPIDHGAPLRLVVPGWYGCTAIKWVSAIEGVARDGPATEHMLEFASRTHQPEGAALASDFRPATIDFAAMPVLVRGPDPEGRFEVEGIAWGDPTGVDRVFVHYRSEGGDETEELLDFELQAPSSWTVWSHRFAPPETGVWQVGLRAESDQGEVQTRRLDSGYYRRSFRIT